MEKNSWESTTHPLVGPPVRSAGGVYEESNPDAKDSGFSLFKAPTPSSRSVAYISVEHMPDEETAWLKAYLRGKDKFVSETARLAQDQADAGSLLEASILARIVRDIPSRANGFMGNASVVFAATGIKDQDYGADFHKSMKNIKLAYSYFETPQHILYRLGLVAEQSEDSYQGNSDKKLTDLDELITKSSESGQLLMAAMATRELADAYLIRACPEESVAAELAAVELINARLVQIRQDQNFMNNVPEADMLKQEYIVALTNIVDITAELEVMDMRTYEILKYAAYIFTDATDSGNISFLAQQAKAYSKLERNASSRKQRKFFKNETIYAENRLSEFELMSSGKVGAVSRYEAADERQRVRQKRPPVNLLK